MKRLLLALALAALVPVGAEARDYNTLGDDNPYPLACMDFSGRWRSDEGEILEIVQGERCRWLKLSGSYDSNGSATTIVPDDKERLIRGSKWKGTIRYRWNNKNYATVIETHRAVSYSDKRVTELVLLEKVNNNLLLESTYRTTDWPGQDCEPKKEYHQRVFRLTDFATQR